MKHTHTATALWERQGANFSDNKFSRAHQWRFDGGAVVAASAAPAVVPPPLSDPAAVDPEEAFIASLSSCHLLWFLHIARAAGLVVDRYEDTAIGEMGRNAQGKAWVAKVTLNPTIEFSGTQPSAEQLAQMHHKAHVECYIANSVLTEVTVAGIDAFHS